MTLQQLRYLIAIAESGSISLAAERIYASQSNLSLAIKELEREYGITIFTRSNRGVTLTNEGTELLAYARQVVEQADMLDRRFAHRDAGVDRLAISTQHYAFCVQAFIETVEEYEGENYDFVMREAPTFEIIENVRDFRSDIGVLYTDKTNARVLGQAFKDARLEFHPLFAAPVHVFVGADHPLADRDVIHTEDLEPYPRYSFEQGTTNSFYFSEEPLGALPHSRNIRISDRATLTTLLTDFIGYTLSTGILTPEMQRGIVSIPLDTDVVMTVGYLTHREHVLGPLQKSYLAHLRDVVRNNASVVEYLE
jgi:DNA-binding transcriptional LysR family regulator